MSQSKRLSTIEALTNTIVGILISICIIQYLLPLLGVYISIEKNVTITAIFFVASTLRSYIIRRIFNYDRKTKTN